jgi:hypothetical protein
MPCCAQMHRPSPSCCELAPELLGAVLWSLVLRAGRGSADQQAPPVEHTAQLRHRPPPAPSGRSAGPPGARRGSRGAPGGVAARRDARFHCRRHQPLSSGQSSDIARGDPPAAREAAAVART